MNVSSPIFRRRLDVKNAALNDTLIKRMTPLLTQLIHNPQPNLILLHHLLEPLLQHLILPETAILEILRERCKVRECTLANILLPFARKYGAKFWGRGIGGYLCEIVLKVWLERDDRCGECGSDAGLDGADGGLVVLLDGLFGVEVERCTAAAGGGSGGAVGVDNVGMVFGCRAAVMAEILFVEDDAQTAVADFAAGEGDSGVGSRFEC